jgi:DNA topoisomerase-1
MGENLVIVESPAKAKTIEKFLGAKYTVKSSFGHIRDLSKKNYGIDIANGFEPMYEISEDKRKVVSELKKLAKEAKVVWLASDEDREGEAIAWHLAEALNLDKKTTKRIVFHEITKNAILHSIENPREINQNLVNAQQARRVLDRLVGFELSPVLWKKVKPSLSAGRVQSVAVRLLVEREREIMAFQTTSAFKVTAQFEFKDKNGKTTTFKAELPTRFDTAKQATDFLEICKKSQYKISSVVTKPASKSPAAPFTTSTLQQEASRKFNFSVAQTMTIAQKLYESGYITYMRTDSLNLSKEALAAAKTQIIAEFGNDYHHLRTYKTKTKGAQEAHEAIRPTYMQNQTIEGTAQEQRLYELIWKRTIASQMSDAQLEKTNVDIDISLSKEKFVAKGEILTFEGFLKVYIESTDDENTEQTKGFLPTLKVGQIVLYNEIEAIERFTAHPPRYTEASLVKKLEELGIGRPSTYAPTISTVQKRGYVVKEDRQGTERKYAYIILKQSQIKQSSKSELTGQEKSKLFPTDIGMVVTDFLLENFEKIMDYHFTADVEKEFDRIADGKMKWNKMISDFYGGFHQLVEHTLEHTERNSGERELGIDPETGKMVSSRIGRFGAIVQLGTTEDEEKPRFASLRKDQHIETITLDEALVLLKMPAEGRFLGIHPTENKKIFSRMGRFGAMVQLGEADANPSYASLKAGQSVDTITLEQALELLKLPRTVGEFEGKPIVAASGRFGPYLSHNSKFTSLKKNDDPLTVTLKRAIELIEEKRKSDSDKQLKTFENSDLKVLKDRWGKPCIFYKKKYTRLTAKENYETMSLEDCFKIIGLDPETELKKSSTKKTDEKKASSTKTAVSKTNSTKTATSKATSKTTAKTSTKSSAKATPKVSAKKK